MKGGLPLLVLLASALTFLASLFLPWRETPLGGNVDGWYGGAGDIAVLLVVAIVLATVAAVRRPQSAARLPIGSLGVALGYFAVAVALEVRTASAFPEVFTGNPQTHHPSWTYGFYLGLASAAIAVLSVPALRSRAHPRPRGAGDAVAAALGIALLISFLLPWLGQQGISTTGIESPAAAIAALGLILSAPQMFREETRRWRVPLALAAAILTGAAASATPFSSVHRYGTWIGVGCAVSLVALEAARGRPLQLPSLPSGPAALGLGAAALLIVALFLPWQELSTPGHSFGFNGWYAVTGAAAGGLCLLLLATPARPALENYLLDVAIAIALFVSTLGTLFRQYPEIHFGYGAFVGFAAAGILLVAALVRLRPGRVERRRALARAVPLAVSVLCVAAIVVPTWFVLPRSSTPQATPLYYGWVQVAGMLLALYLVRLWTISARRPLGTGNGLTLVPLTLLTLAALELIRFRNREVIWGAVILVGLCLVLALFGWIEENNIRVPDEVWRVDRLPEPES
jgi:hypothetical protein